MTTTTSSKFLGLPKSLSSYENSRVAVLPVPYERTVSYGRGTANGPRAIIEASAQVELYDEELECEPSEIGISTLDSLPVEGVLPSNVSDIISPAVAKIIADGKLPFVLGGEHSITPGVVSAVYAAHKDITVIQFDAHADLRQEYEGEKMSHASAMARVRDFCPVIHLGIRNISVEEAKWAKRERFPIFYAHEMRLTNRWMKDALRKISTDKVYVTIDVDAFDSSVMPATGTPEPGGLGWWEVTDFVKLLTREKDVVGFDLVELAPIVGLHSADFLAAKLVYKCIGYWSLQRYRTM